MEWQILILFIGLLAFIFHLNNSLKNDFNKRIDDLKEMFRAELSPINEKLNNHITGTDKKIDALDTKIIRLEEGQKLILKKLEK